MVGGTSEYTRPKNFALLFYCDDPEKFIPYTRIETVLFQDDIGDKFEEKIFHGPIHLQYAEVMSYLRSQVITEKVVKIEGQAEAMRAYNYPYAALEEVVANVLYHKSYDDSNPIKIRINLDSIQVYSLEGPMPPLRADDLKMPRVVSRNYRNRRIGDILKELDITEGRSTGFPKIYNALRKNGSPEPIFETDDNNSYFLATIPIHPAFLGTSEKTSEKILDFIKDNPQITAEGIARNLNISSRAVEYQLKKLQDEGILKRVGGRKEGHWKIIG
jgi:ATP-dependent DNA helicase RecG